MATLVWKGCHLDLGFLHKSPVFAKFKPTVLLKYIRTYTPNAMVELLPHRRETICCQDHGAHSVVRTLLQQFIPYYNSWVLHKLYSCTTVQPNSVWGYHSCLSRQDFPHLSLGVRTCKYHSSESPGVQQFIKPSCHTEQCCACNNIVMAHDTTLQCSSHLAIYRKH